jgi:Tfp pilus assembly protein PilF
MGIPAAWNNLGVVHFSLKEYTDAQSAFEKCLSADPGHTGAQRNMQKLHETQHSSA